MGMDIAHIFTCGIILGMVSMGFVAMSAMQKDRDWYQKTYVEPYIKLKQKYGG